MRIGAALMNTHTYSRYSQVMKLGLTWIKWLAQSTQASKICLHGLYWA